MHISEKLRRTYPRPVLYGQPAKEAAVQDVVRGLWGGVKGLFGRGAARYTSADLARLEQIKNIPVTQNKAFRPGGMYTPTDLARLEQIKNTPVSNVRGWSGRPVSGPGSNEFGHAETKILQNPLLNSRAPSPQPNIPNPRPTPTTALRGGPTQVRRSDGQVFAVPQGVFTPAEVERLSRAPVEHPGWAKLQRVESGPRAAAPTPKPPARQSVPVRRSDGQMFTLPPGVSLTPRELQLLSSAPANHPGWATLQRAGSGSPTPKPTMNSLKRNPRSETSLPVPEVGSPAGELSTVSAARARAARGEKSPQSWRRQPDTRAEATAVRANPLLRSEQSLARQGVAKVASLLESAHVYNIWRAVTARQMFA